MNATGVLSRSSAGNGITLVAGIYEIHCHILVNPGSNDKRGTCSIEIYDGTNIIDVKSDSGYVRSVSNVQEHAIQSFHKINLTTGKTIQVRIKYDSHQDGITGSTNGGSVIVSKV